MKEAVAGRDVAADSVRRHGLGWPLAAFVAWLAAWSAYAALRELAAPPAAALTVAMLLGAALAMLAGTPWRRVFVAAGFPLSLAASGLGGTLPGWTWLLPLAALALLYPLKSWRDAPLFPTPDGALVGLAHVVPLRPDARIVDAGCGLGDGLRELHRAYPAARLEGWEWSLPLAAWCALRCRGSFGSARLPARIRRRDIWRADWSAHDMVYLFQRPETLPRAVDKAARELRPGAWLASLEFEAPALQPQAVHACPDGRRVWLYQAPFKRR